MPIPTLATIANSAPINERSDNVHLSSDAALRTQNNDLRKAQGVHPELHRLPVAVSQDPTLLPSPTRASRTGRVHAPREVHGLIYGNDMDAVPPPCTSQNAQSLPLLPFSKANRLTIMLVRVGAAKAMTRTRQSLHRRQAGRST